LTPDLIKEPEWIFPFMGMRVGDSFFIPTLRVSQMIYAIETASKKEGMRFKVYPSSKDGHMGVRAWRMT
jgi:hypothetical protein